MGRWSRSAPPALHRHILYLPLLSIATMADANQPFSNFINLMGKDAARDLVRKINTCASRPGSACLHHMQLTHSRRRFMKDFKARPTDPDQDSRYFQVWQQFWACAAVVSNAGPRQQLCRTAGLHGAHGGRNCQAPAVGGRQCTGAGRGSGGAWAPSST